MLSFPSLNLSLPISTSIAEVFSAACGNPVKAVNDADAAGVAIMKVGLGKGKKGVVLIITIVIVKLFIMLVLKLTLGTLMMDMVLLMF